MHINRGALHNKMSIHSIKQIQHNQIKVKNSRQFLILKRSISFSQRRQILRFIHVDIKGFFFFYSPTHSHHPYGPPTSDKVMLQCHHGILDKRLSGSKTVFTYHCLIRRGMTAANNPFPVCNTHSQSAPPTDLFDWLIVWSALPSLLKELKKNCTLQGNSDGLSPWNLEFTHPSISHWVRCISGDPRRFCVDSGAVWRIILIIAVN